MKEKKYNFWLASGNYYCSVLNCWYNLLLLHIHQQIRYNTPSFSYLRGFKKKTNIQNGTTLIVMISVHMIMGLLLHINIAVVLDTKRFH